MLMRVCIRADRGRGQHDLRETGVVRVPELAAPGAIQFVDGFVLSLEPLAKRIMRFGILIERSGIFIIDLPSNDRRMTSIVLPLRDDPSCGFRIELEQGE